jgi:phospholipid N-methyltransferase
MVRLLKRRFPSLKIALGDASELRALLRTFLAKDNIEISHVVSSLPLRSLPENVVTNIIREVYAVLPKEGKLVQYTYNLSKTSHPCLSGFKRIRTTVVWANVPPARLDVFQKNGKSSN